MEIWGCTVTRKRLTAVDFFRKLQQGLEEKKIVELVALLLDNLFYTNKFLTGYSSDLGHVISGLTKVKESISANRLKQGESQLVCHVAGYLLTEWQKTNRRSSHKG